MFSKYLLNKSFVVVEDNRVLFIYLYFITGYFYFYYFSDNRYHMKHQEREELGLRWAVKQLVDV